jgi:hypothetical protein
MPKLLKIALVLGIATLALGARYLGPAPHSALQESSKSIVPLELMRSTAPLTETPVDSYM